MKFNSLLETSSLEFDISLAPFLIIFAIFIIWELLHGLRRGVFRQVLHTVCTVLAAVIAFLAVNNMCQTFLDEFTQQTVEELLVELQASGAAEELGMSADTLTGLSEHLENADWLLALPIGTIAVPFLFALLFVVILLLAKIVYFIIRLILHLPKGGGLIRRLTGAAVGAVEGAVVCAILFLPVISMFTLVDSGVDAVREKNDPAYTEFIEEYDATAKPVINNAIFEAIEAMGGEAMLNSFATVQMNGKEVNLRDELVVAVSMAFELGTLEDADFKNLTEEEQSTINSVVDTLGASEYMSTVASDLLRAMAYIVENGNLPIEIDPPFDTLVNSVISIFETSSRDNLEGDIETILSVYYILCEDGVLTAVEDGGEETITNALIARDENGDTVISKVIEKLKQNERTEPLVVTLSQLSIAMLADKLQIDGITTEVYDNVTAKLEGVLAINRDDYASDDEYKSALTESIDTALSDNGIVLKDEIVSEMADLVDEEKQKNPDMTVDDIILTYYDAYLQHQENKDAEGAPAE